MCHCPLGPDSSPRRDRKSCPLAQSADVCSHGGSVAKRRYRSRIRSLGMSSSDANEPPALRIRGIVRKPLSTAPYCCEALLRGTLRRIVFGPLGHVRSFRIPRQPRSLTDSTKLLHRHHFLHGYRKCKPLCCSGKGFPFGLVWIPAGVPKH